MGDTTTLEDELNDEDFLSGIMSASLSISETNNSSGSSTKKLKYDILMGNVVGKWDEDRFKITKISLINEEALHLVTVLDGHGSNDCVEFVIENLHKNIVRNNEFITLINEPNLIRHKRKMFENILSEAYELTDQQYLLKENHKDINSGAVAVTLMLYLDQVIVSNIGDCKAILFTPPIATTEDDDDDSDDDLDDLDDDKEEEEEDGENFVHITTEHRADSEMERLEHTGAQVINGRVDNQLQPSRAFGDIELKLKYKNGILALPAIFNFEIVHEEIKKTSKAKSSLLRKTLSFHRNKDKPNFAAETNTFIVLGSDGIFDNISPKEMSKIVNYKLNTKKSEKAAEHLCKIASKRTEDDITALIIHYHY